MDALAQRRDAIDKANAIRTARAQIKKQVQAGEITVAGLMADPPDVLSSMAVCDVIRFAHKSHRGSDTWWFENLGKHAAIERVNLCVPLGRASVRTRAWIATNTRKKVYTRA
jgi:hypothetical protein